MKIYTRTGDDGTTQLMGPTRVPKDHPRVAAYGAVDELNAWLGYLHAMGLPSPWAERVQEIQRDLFVIGSYLALDPAVADRAPALPPPPEERIPQMEGWIDECEAVAGPTRVFILGRASPERRAAHRPHGLPAGGAGRGDPPSGGTGSLLDPGLSQSPLRPAVHAGPLGQRGARG